MTGIITATVIIMSMLSPMAAETPTPMAAAHHVYLPIVMKRAPATGGPMPTPTPRVLPATYPLKSFGYAHYYSAERWHFYVDITMSPAYPYVVSDMVMLAFKGFDAGGELVYENRDQHPADPDVVPPGGTTRIEWDVPEADVPRGIEGLWFMLRWRP